MPQKKSCGAVVFNKNPKVHYLLLHYGAGHWGFSRGLVEKDESEKDTVLRELEEETGIVDTRFIDGFREKISYFYRRRGATIYKEVIYYLIETLSNQVRLSYEHVGYRWLTYKLALDKLYFKNAKDVLTKANTYLQKQGINS